MTFTDEDLKRLKEHIEDYCLWADKKKIDALLSRLEAAELYLECREKGFSKSQLTKFAIQWRKAAGK